MSEIPTSLEELENEAVEYIRKLFEGNADGHDVLHSKRVHRTAMELAHHHPEADRRIVSLAALLHDADDPKLFDTHAQENAKSFLARCALPPDEVTAICEAIASVSFSQNRDSDPPGIEAALVRDADRLDAIGAIAVARTFAFGGKHNRCLSESVAHLNEKCTELAAMMCTAEGEQLAAERHVFLLHFLEELDRETRGLL